MVKRALIILAIAVSHFIVTIFLFGVVYARGMAAFDSGAPSTVFDSVVGHVAQILLFPFIPFAQYIHVQSGGPAEWALFFGNSFLWAGVLYSIVASIRHHRRTRESKSPATI
jgi:hypothetical protein